MKSKATLDNRITFRLPTEMVAEFNQIIENNDASKSKVLRTLVTAWVQQQRGTASA